MILLPILVASTPVADWPTYSNVQFAYEICYPRGELIPGPEADSGDGRVFTAKDGGKLLVFGRFNADNQSLATIAAAEGQSLQGAHGRSTYSAQGRDWAVVSGSSGAQLFYSKVFVRNDRVVTFELTYPHSAAKRYSAIAARLNRCFRPLTPAF